jgi:ABC-type polysaccharide/polyol phosphate export permease
MGAYLTSIWDCRYFWLSLVKMDLRNRYRGSVLGIGWSLLHPIATTLVICAVYYKIVQAPVREFVPFLMAGLACWTYLVGVTLQGCQCFITAEAYIRQHPLPLAVYPLRTALGAGVHLLLALVVVVLLSWVMRGLDNTPALLCLAPAVVLLTLFGWSMGVIAGFINTIFRDTHHLLEIGFQLLFYLSAVIYPKELLYENQLGWLVDYNPLVAFMNLIRDPVLDGRIPRAWDIGFACVVVLVLGSLAAVILSRWQKKLIHYL